MPAGDHSGYANMAYGHSYYDYVLEVFDYALQIFPLSNVVRITLLQVIQWWLRYNQVRLNAR